MNNPDKPVGYRPESADSPRVSRDEAAIRTAAIWALRSTCLRKQVGAVILKDNRVVSTGYAGAEAGEDHCLDVGCLIDPIHGGCTRTKHAEWNAIVDARNRKIDLAGTTIYCTISPCLACARMIVDSGISFLMYYNEYRDHSGLDLLASYPEKILVEKFSAHYGILLRDLDELK